MKFMIVAFFAMLSTTTVLAADFSQPANTRNVFEETLEQPMYPGDGEWAVLNLSVQSWKVNQDSVTVELVKLNDEWTQSYEKSAVRFATLQSIVLVIEKRTPSVFTNDATRTRSISQAVAFLKLADGNQVFKDLSAYLYFKNDVLESVSVYLPNQNDSIQIYKK